MVLLWTMCLVWDLCGGRRRGHGDDFGFGRLVWPLPFGFHVCALTRLALNLFHIRVCFPGATAAQDGLVMNRPTKGVVSVQEGVGIKFYFVLKSDSVHFLHTDFSVAVGRGLS